VIDVTALDQLLIRYEKMIRGWGYTIKAIEVPLLSQFSWGCCFRMMYRFPNTVYC
jgi:hypothetical protein